MAVVGEIRGQGHACPRELDHLGRVDADEFLVEEVSEDKARIAASLRLTDIAIENAATTTASRSARTGEPTCAPPPRLELRHHPARLNLKTLSSREP